MSAPIMLDLDASPIPNQTGWAVLDLNGHELKSNTMKHSDVQLLFQMLQESASTTDSLERMTVTFPGSTRFVVTRDESHVYMVQTREA
eukprot:CAMPEP_0176002744 /NCGR_PEP_ID=MMETSP0120_2-20121206/807_1 /TAXON_ID=160619 /ORGANISM="Kryptoperidinium foliaceum, Strain CCMP 1326" /LENGTH=87 /DNA_ID=CAMNT_0017335347 /DNA_START=44 /DNA_END=307 /DNA_ORIENTATION=-